MAAGLELALVHGDEEHADTRRRLSLYATEPDDRRDDLMTRLLQVSVMQIDRHICRSLCLRSLLAVLLLSCNLRSTEIYEIPDGYRGWVQIRMKRPSCPPLPVTRDGSIVFRINRDGTSCTSSQTDTRWGSEAFYYVRDGKRIAQLSDEQETGSLIWGGEYRTVSDPANDEHLERDRIVFFVGTIAEYDARKPLR
jgi:hypothetical protein